LVKPAQADLELISGGLGRKASLADAGKQMTNQWGRVTMC